MNVGGIVAAVVTVSVVIIVVVVIVAATVHQRKRRRIIFIKGNPTYLKTRLYVNSVRVMVTLPKGYYQLKLKWHIRLNRGWISPTGPGNLKNTETERM